MLDFRRGTCTRARAARTVRRISRRLSPVCRCSDRGRVSTRERGSQSLISGGGAGAISQPRRFSAAGVAAVCARRDLASCTQRHTSATLDAVAPHHQVCDRIVEQLFQRRLDPRRCIGLGHARLRAQWRVPAGAPPRDVSKGSPRAALDRRQRIATTTAIAAAETPAAINPTRGMVRGSARLAMARTRKAAVPADIVRP